MFDGRDARVARGLTHNERVAGAQREHVRVGGYRPHAGRWRVPTAVLVAAAVLLLAVFQWVQPRLAFQAAGLEGPLAGSLTGSRDFGTFQAAVMEQRAVAVMSEAIQVIARAREAAGFPVDPSVDPNRTGLIGFEWSSITTTLGDLQAKRTATNPLWAAYVVRRMVEAGVEPGDVVWASFSGSFPGLNLAVLAAAEAMDVELIAVSSLSASTWGANVPGFTWIDMEAAVRDVGVVRQGTVAVTLGGDNDQGPDMFSLLAGDPEAGVRALRDAAARHPWPLLEPRSLDEAVAVRLETFHAVSGLARPALFINAGGGHASLGHCADSHVWPAGLTMTGRACEGGTPGLLHVMSADGVPVLHLLNVRSMATAAGIPIDGRFAAHAGESTIE